MPKHHRTNICKIFATPAVTPVTTILVIALFLLFFSTQSLAIIPANVVILIDQDESQRQQTINLLFSETWEMLEGEYDVRFTTPGLDKVTDLYGGVDAVIAVGEPGLRLIKKYPEVDKPTIVLHGAVKSAPNLDSPNQHRRDIFKSADETQQNYIKRIVANLRDSLRKN